MIGIGRMGFVLLLWLLSFQLTLTVPFATATMRHAVEFSAKVRLLVARDDELRKPHASFEDVPGGTSIPYGMVLRADGGSDWNQKNLWVQLSMVFLFIDL
jgi:hypothetical protein